MPCRDYDESYDRQQTQKENDKLTKFLCTILSTLELENELGHFAELFDYKEGGISRKELFAWWEAHKEEDRKRKERAREAAERKEKKDAALSKLTPEERKLLGVK